MSLKQRIASARTAFASSCGPIRAWLLSGTVAQTQTVSESFWQTRTLRNVRFLNGAVFISA